MMNAYRLENFLNLFSEICVNPVHLRFNPLRFFLPITVGFFLASQNFSVSAFTSPISSLLIHLIQFTQFPE